MVNDPAEETPLVTPETTKPHQTAFEIFKEEIVLLKWRVLVFACFLTFGSYYIYDFPGSIGTSDTGASIQQKFTAKGLSYTQEMNLALYAVYNWPNSVLAIFGGLLIDKYLGLRKATMLFTVLVTLGALLFWVGVLVTNFPLMLVARVIFGMGGESLSVAQSAIIARWFKQGRGLALAFGITVSFSRVGSSFNFLFSPMLADDVSIDVAVLAGLGACAFSLISCIALIYLDVIGQRRGVIPPETKESAQGFRLREIKEMPLLLWIACGICVFAYCAIFPWVGIAENFFQVKYGTSHQEAGRYVALYQITSALGSTLVGGMVDNLGRFCQFMITACAGFTLYHVLYIITYIPPPVMTVALGIIYSLLVSSLWPSIPYTVEAAHVGFAYGVITAMQNFGLAVYALIAGAVLDAYTPAASNATMAPTHFFLGDETTTVAATKAPHKPLPTLSGYYAAEGLFAGTAGVALLLCILFMVVDRVKHAGMLGANPRVREERKKAFFPDAHVNSKEKDVDAVDP